MRNPSAEGRRHALYQPRHATLSPGRHVRAGVRVRRVGAFRAPRGVTSEAFGVTANNQKTASEKRVQHQEIPNNDRDERNKGEKLETG